MSHSPQTEGTAEEDATVDDIDAPTREELAGAIEDLTARVEGLSTLAHNQREELAAKNERIEDLEREVEELRDETKRLDARTDLLSLVGDSSKMTGKQRSKHLILHLQAEAEKKRKNGKPAKVSVNRDQAERALQHPDVDRTAIYKDMERAERLVGNTTVLRYANDTASENQLKLNLEAGKLPARFTRRE